MPGPVYGIPSLDQVPAPVGNVSFNAYRGTNLADPTNPQDISSKNYVDNAISGVSGQNPGSQIISGCGVAWSGTGLIYNVSAGTYSINSTTYTLAAQQVTLAAADSSNPRIDLFIANTSGVADKITGTPSSNPVAPGFDPATQIQLPGGFALVPAGSTTPNVTNTLLYDEAVGANTEWNASTSGATWNTASTNNPNTGSKDIEATSVGTGAYVQLAKGSGTVDPSTFASLVFWIRSKASWASNRSITISLLKDGVQYGNGVTLRDGLLGFSSSNTSGYQQIVIPLTSFNINANPINQVRFTIAGSGGSIGFYLDTINLQAAISSNSVFNGIPTTYNTTFGVPGTSCWVATGFLTLANNSSTTIPSGSNLFIMGGSGTLQTPNVYPDSHAFGGLTQTTVRTPADFQTSSGSLVDITGLTFSAAAGKTYEVECFLTGFAAASNAVQFSLAFSGTFANVNTANYIMISSAQSGFVTTNQAVGVASQSAFSVADSLCKIWGIIKPLTAGNITIKVLHTGGALTTIYRGSRMTVTTLN